MHTDLIVADQHLKQMAPSFWNFTHLTPKIAHSLNRMIVQNVVTGCTMLINRPLKQLAYPISEYAVMHDWWLALVASAFGHVAHLPLPSMHYRQHGNNSLGAKKYTLKNYIIKGIQRRFTPSQQRKYSIQHAQTQDFYTRFQNKLSTEQKEMIQAYLHLPSTGYFRGRFTIFKHGFFKNGLIRQLGTILFTKQP